jgi:hypothetical protein
VYQRVFIPSMQRAGDPKDVASTHTQAVVAGGEIGVLSQGPDRQNESVRDNLRAMATKTMAITEAGAYRSPAGRDER